MRFGQIVLAYFVIGAVMFGGGAISFGDAGMAGFFINDTNDGFEPSESAEQSINESSGAITELINVTLGGIQLVFKLVAALLEYLNWPIVTLLEYNAPPMAVLLIGGSFQVAFYVSFIQLLRRSS